MSILSKLLAFFFGKPKPKPVPVPPVVVPPTPTPTGLYVLTVKVTDNSGQPLGNSVLDWDGENPGSATTDENGVYVLPERAEQGFNINVKHANTDAGSYSLGWVGVHLDSSRDVVVALTLTAKPAYPFPPESGVVTIVNRMFVCNGQPWQWRGFTDFLLFYRFLIGENIDALLEERQQLGANVLRVLGMVAWDYLNPRFFVGNFPDYYTKLVQFIDKLAARGMRVEFVIFADAQIAMPEQNKQRDHASIVMSRLQGKWNVFVETCNEPFKNGVDVNAVTPPSVGILRATGNYNPTELADRYDLPMLDYGTTHTERKDEWPRTAKDLQDLRDGFENNGKSLQATNKPWVSDEPMGADEDNKPGSRSNVPDDFAWHAAGAMLMGAGATFHSTDGGQSQLLRPRQKQCGFAFFDVFHWIPAGAQIAGYQRGAADGGPGVGNMPMEHFDNVGAHVDDGALRTFCKNVDGKEYCVAIRAGSSWTAKGRDGWQVKEQHGPRGSIVMLQR